MHKLKPEDTTVLPLILSFALVGLVALAIAGYNSPLFYSVVLSAALSAAVLRQLSPTSSLLRLTFINLIAVYAAFFALFTEEVFDRIGPGSLAFGFALPILLFLAGFWLHKEEIRSVVVDPTLRRDGGVLRALAWLMPVWLVGAVVIVLSRISEATINTELGFLAAMLLIGAIVVAVTRDVAVFLVDTGLLFEEFFTRVARLVVPAFAFLTFYALIAVIFASSYCVISRYAVEAHFRVATEVRALSFSEALHFSVVTLSTVGYGDIVPVSSLARGLAAIEVVCGVMLLLFGVSELLDYTRERRGRHGRDRRD